MLSSSHHHNITCNTMSPETNTQVTDVQSTRATSKANDDWTSTAQDTALSSHTGLTSSHAQSQADYHSTFVGDDAGHDQLQKRLHEYYAADDKRQAEKTRQRKEKNSLTSKVGQFAKRFLK